jgi:hypothetical protein
MLKAAEGQGGQHSPGEEEGEKEGEEEAGGEARPSGRLVDRRVATETIMPCPYGVEDSPCLLEDDILPPMPPG